ncbi:MAG: PqqD family peptide modification chaperone [Magnetococcales bacterium]|nr:PqqD family peptide modification chaperone [Magnetococcales bacterium]
MSSPLFSSSWYRMAALRPRLRSQAHIFRHSYRGERWHVVQDLASGRFLRLNTTAYWLVTLMDGHRTMDNIWQMACQALQDETPTQDELLQLLAQLHQANLLLTDKNPDLEELHHRHDRMQKLKLIQYLANPLSLKIPLFDPDRLLTLLVRLMPRFLQGWLLLVWLAVVLSGLAMGAMHWDELTQDIVARVFTPDNMLMLWLVFPVVKGIHELGHGLAVKLFGGQCHEVGIMLLMLAPIPYVDASQAAALASRRQRILVGLAGMMAELFLAALAIWLWSWTAPGPARALFHHVVLLAGFTTVVFNMNPLLRFDGYYVLADWLEIPNLGQKANQYVGYLVNRYLFGVQHGLIPPHLTPRERGWLVGYAVASFANRMVVSVSILLMVAERFFFLGVLLALWAAYAMLLLPLTRMGRYLVSHPTLEGQRQRAILLSGGAVAVLVGLLLLLPCPAWTSTEGVIWMPEQSRIRAPVPCFAQAVVAPVGALVTPGTPLLTCDDPQLTGLQAQLIAIVEEFEARLAQVGHTDRVTYQIVQSDLHYAQQRLADVTQRQAEMTMRAPQAGRFIMSASTDFPGRYLERGDVLAYVLDPGRFTLLAVVPQGDVDLVRNHTERVELRSVDHIRDLLPARIARAVPAATTELPSLALSLQGGGKIGLDPNAHTGQDPKALVSLFHFEIEFTGDAIPKTLGNRVFVRFVPDPEPLGVQWYRSLRQLFLKHFAV